MSAPEVTLAPVVKLALPEPREIPDRPDRVVQQARQDLPVRWVPRDRRDRQGALDPLGPLDPQDLQDGASRALPGCLGYQDL
jgi:hypothetical protein